MLWSMRGITTKELAAALGYSGPAAVRYRAAREGVRPLIQGTNHREAVWPRRLLRDWASTAGRGRPRKGIANGQTAQ